MFGKYKMHYANTALLILFYFLSFTLISQEGGKGRTVTVYLDSSFLPVDDMSQATYKYYYIEYAHKKLEWYRRLPVKIADKVIKNAYLRNCQFDQICLLDSLVSFEGKTGKWKNEFLFENGYIIYQKNTYRNQKATIYLPSFKVEPNFEYSEDEIFYTEKFEDYDVSFLNTYTASDKSNESFYNYFNGKKWKRGKVDQ